METVLKLNSIAGITPAHLFKYAEDKNGSIEYFTNVYRSKTYRGEEMKPYLYDRVFKLSTGRTIAPASMIGIKTSNNAYYWFEVTNEEGQFKDSLSFSHRYSQNTGKSIKAWRTGSAYLNKVYNHFNNI